jgi:hypothetical protein
MLACLLPLLLIVLCFPKSSAPARINTGLAFFTLALLTVPAMDAAYVKGRPGLYGAFDVTVAATVLCGVADALVQGGVIGFAGELPGRYMQAVIAGTAASGGLLAGCLSIPFSFFSPHLLESLPLDFFYLRYLSVNRSSPVLLQLLPKFWNWSCRIRDLCLQDSSYPASDQNSQMAVGTSRFLL